MTFKLIICQEPIKSRCRQNIVSGNLGYETPVLDKGKQWKFDYVELAWETAIAYYYNQSRSRQVT
jgi:hypothetical protein